MDQPNLESTLGLSFRDKTLFARALTHRSFLNDNRWWTGGQNERLEFLGDAVIELVVSEFIYAAFPDKPEGELTELRSKLVSTEAIHEVSKPFELLTHLRVSNGEKRDTNQRKCERLIACAFEAIVGALYLDQGYGAVQEFVKRTLLARLDEALVKGLDAKSALQEKTQAVLRITPTYRTLEETGPDHGKRFVVGVYFGSTLIAKGHGPSKKRAEEKAAESAMIIKGWAKSPI